MVNEFLTPGPTIVGIDKEELNVSYSTDPADFQYMNVNVPCQSACPALTNIPAYIRALYENKYGLSYEINRMVNLFPGTLGRICSRPCELKCRHGESELGKPVSICQIKRAAADNKSPVDEYSAFKFAPLGKRVCVVGSGPAGLAAAHDLAVLGFDVTIYEALNEPGGMLRYGIPDFRLPRHILNQEIQHILGLGISLRTGVRIGAEITIESLLSDFHATLFATGCYQPVELGVPDQDLRGVYPGLNFVMDVASGKEISIGKNVLVIGAGFTAFDCARLGLRLGAENVSICIRGFEEDLRVTHDEILEAKREGIRIRSLVVSKRVVGREKVEGVEFYRTKPAQRSVGGRRSVEPIPGSEFILDADMVVVAIGQAPDSIPGPGQKNDRGVLVADRKTFQTSMPGFYVTGDYLTGPSTVIECIASGRKAAEKIAEDLTGRKFREWTVRVQDARITDRDRSWDLLPRFEMPTLLPIKDRLKTSEAPEVELGYSIEQANEESKRCYLCYLHYEIDITKCIYCRYCIDNAPRDCIKLVKDVLVDETGAISGLVETTKWVDVNAVIIDNSRCIRCGECVRVCPVDCISVSKVELVQRHLIQESRS